MVELRQLGKSGPKLNPLGLGCMGMSEFYGPSNEDENIKVLTRALEKGCVFWDTADAYGLGANEILLSKILKDHRDKIFLCTKFGCIRDEKGTFTGISGKPEYVRKCCEASLKRLGVQTIDLYYQHRIDRTIPIEETIKAMAELVKEGKVRYLGLSECTADELRRAHKVHPIAAIQMEYSPWALEIESNGVLEAARELGVAIVAYSPLGRGFLTGTIRSPGDIRQQGDYRGFMPRFAPEHFSVNIELVNKISELAAKKGVTPSQFTLAWVLSRGDDFFVIPGTKRLKYLEENLKATEITLTAEEKAEMQKIIDSVPISGERASYSEPEIDAMR